ncbi:MAG: hypothetical protein ACR2N5_03960 [Solirubrobacterales bacterium]
MSSEARKGTAGAGSDGEPRLEDGYVEPGLRAELGDELGLRYLVVERGSGRSSRGAKQRLRILSDRFDGADAILLRQRPIPAAYRSFYRQIGLDPDQGRTPVEHRALERMQHGRFRSLNLVDDALTIAIVESSVAVRALDADRAEGRLGIRETVAGEALDGRPGDLPGGTLVIADEKRPLAFLFGATGAGRGVTRKTRRTTLLAVRVAGVPEIAVEEALWLAADVMAEP